MKKNVALFLVIAILSSTGVANAGKKSGLYVGGSIGQASIDVSENSYDFSGDDFAFKIFGGYNFGIIPLLDLAAEGSYVDFGQASSSGINTEVDVTGWDIFGLAAFNLGPVGIFGKAGQIFWSSDSNINSLDNSGNDMAYGIGIRFHLGSVAIRGEYEYFDIEGSNIGMYSVGASWTF